MQILFALVFLVLAAPVLSQDRGADIRAVIAAQLDAFRADDFARAFSFASPGIRTIFQNAENFGAMVRNGYPMVWRPAEVSMGALSEQAGRLVQSVLLRDAAGRLHVADYSMVLVNGEWRIDGVTLRSAPDQGA